jgi:hypothetical protein
MIITNTSGVEFPVCPRCGSIWECDNPNNRYSLVMARCISENCIIVYDDLTLGLCLGDKYGVEWWKDHCEIIDEEGHVIHVPTLLPYDITFDRLKLLLTFS